MQVMQELEDEYEYKKGLGGWKLRMDEGQVLSGKE